MHTTTLYNLTAEKINKNEQRTIVTVCQMPTEKFDGYFKHGVALQIDNYDDFKYIMQKYEDIVIHETTAYLEPYNTTYVAVWED
jgi:hypothetical protein